MLRYNQNAKRHRKKNKGQHFKTHVWLIMMKAYRALESVASTSIESTNSCLSDFAVMENAAP